MHHHFRYAVISATTSRRRSCHIVISPIHPRSFSSAMASRVSSHSIVPRGTQLYPVFFAYQMKSTDRMQYRLVRREACRCVVRHGQGRRGDGSRRVLQAGEHSTHSLPSLWRRPQCCQDDRRGHQDCSRGAGSRQGGMNLGGGGNTR